MQQPSCYVFVISSLNDPIYRKVHNKRRKLLSFYNIQYSVLINHQESKIDNKQVPTLVSTEEDEILYNGQGYNPFMTQKFLYAVKMYFRSFPSFEKIPTFIVRINATVYIHFPSLFKHLEELPKERVIAGPNFQGDDFVQGMIMVFSKDVLFNMIQDYKMYDKAIMALNDDVALSYISKPYCRWINWIDHLVMACPENSDKNGVYKLENIQPFQKRKWIFRICNSSDREYDLKNWDVLLDYFDENRKKTKIQNFIIIFFFIILLILVII